MWVRTKKGLYFINQIIVHNSVVYGKAEPMARDIALGDYQDEQRALEVLDEMQDHLNDFKSGYREVFNMPED